VADEFFMPVILSAAKDPAQSHRRSTDGFFAALRMTEQRAIVESVIIVAN
jgi:hypothetical protein